MLKQKKWPLWVIILSIFGWIVAFPMLIARSDMNNHIQGLLSGACVVIGLLEARRHWKERRKQSSKGE